jgi:hypothetical protein
MANTEKYVANHNREVGEIWQGNEYVAFAFSTSEYSAIENAQRIADCLNEADNLREEVKRLRGEYGPKVDYSNAPTLEDYGIRELDIIFATREQEGTNYLYKSQSGYHGFKDKLSEEDMQKGSFRLIWERGGEDA